MLDITFLVNADTKIPQKDGLGVRRAPLNAVVGLISQECPDSRPGGLFEGGLPNGLCNEVRIEEKFISFAIGFKSF